MKHSILAFLLMFTVLFYLGEDKGFVVSGIQGEVAISEYKIMADLRAYINGANEGGFIPARQLYKFGIGNDCIQLWHECFHGVDMAIPKTANKNYVKINL